MKEERAAEQFGDLRHIRINIGDVPPRTVYQSVDRRCGYITSVISHQLHNISYITSVTSH